jgi:hypothetical protein
MDAKQARDILDMCILSDMNNCTAVFGRYDTYYRLNDLGDPDIIPREMVRAICRDLTDRGMVRFRRGLFTEDGEVAGSGYGLTRKGLHHLIVLEEIYND